MSQTVITLAFEHWKAQQAINNSAVILDEFVLANVPNLDAEKPIDRTEQLPAAKYIVHRQAVSAAGLVNENSVVYSVTMGADVGDFEFNWVGLINKATGMLAMIVHAPLQSKIKNADGKQGNVLTRSFLMEYNGAASETQITTPAETWQIDFTARLSGMDERQRLESADIYGAAAFFGDGFLVTRQVSQYSITQGTGYVGGLRCKLSATQNITVTTKPVKVWVDVCWKGTLTSVWAEELKITVANSLANYVQGGIQHYVFAVASIDENGVITDLRPKGTLDGQQGNKNFLRIDKSLSEIAEKGEAAQGSARKNLALGDAATKNAVTSMTDATGGRIPVVGWMGLGANGLILKNADLLSANGVGNALFSQSGGGADNHFGSHGSGVHLSYGTGAGNTLQLSANLFVDPNGNLSVEWLDINRSDGSVRTQKLQKLYGPLNKPTAKDVGALSVDGGTIGNLTVNNQIQVGGIGNGVLNIGDTDSGLRSSVDGQVDLYANGVIRGCWNTTVFSFTGRIIPTDYANFDAKYQAKGSYTPAGEAYTKAVSDERYLQSIRASGTEEYVDIPYPGQVPIPAGAFLAGMVGSTKGTGSGISFHISRVYYRRAQKYIGGAWVNI